MMTVKPDPLVVTEVTDPTEMAQIRARHDRFLKNSDWLQAHIPAVYSQHRGKFICVAGQQLFAADSAPEAVALARKAHPEDDGFLFRYIPAKKLERIYAHSGAMESLR
jgi:hypothetical protein